MNFWYSRNLIAYCLSPCSAIFRSIISVRRWLYRYNIKKTRHFNVPVIVVGNITVGGAGKTPLVVELTRVLRERGLRPGIVSRGYGGKAPYYPYPVTPDADPKYAGDEAVLLARKTFCPMVIAPDRVKAVQKLLADNDCNIVLSDDGLQHYALNRRIEIAVIDGERCFGNGFCLPAGPLREPISRLKEVDFIIINGNILSFPHAPESKAPLTRGDQGGLKSIYNCYSMQLIPESFQQLKHPATRQPADYFKNQTVHAVAGIGNPNRFFNTLRALGLTIIEYAFPDHHLFTRQDFNFADNKLIVMTEKDAVKCQVFADDRFWYLPVTAQLDQSFTKKLAELL